MHCITSGPGSRLVCISSESVGEDLIAPVMVSIAVHCVCSTFFAVPLDPQIALSISVL